LLLPLRVQRTRRNRQRQHRKRYDERASPSQLLPIGVAFAGEIADVAPAPETSAAFAPMTPARRIAAPVNDRRNMLASLARFRSAQTEAAERPLRPFESVF
jgi:hypothetical protein